MSNENLQSLYRHRFTSDELPAKAAIWRVLCEHHFQKYIDPEKDCILDLACGYGEFSNHIKAKRKIAVDLNPDSPGALARDIEFHATRADDLSAIGDGEVDVVFTSNFFEHLPDKSALASVLSEVARVLKLGGTVIAMGPNIKHVPGAYWDFIDHHLPLTELSLAEAFHMAGIDAREVYSKFLPYTTQSRLPQAPFLVRLYLAFPLAWKLLGKQFLLIGSKG